MVDAVGNLDVKELTNVGSRTLYRVRHDSVSTTETIPIDGDESPIVLGDNVVVIGALSEVSGAQPGDSGDALTVTYSAADAHFTIVETGLSDTAVQVWFYLIRGD